MITKRPLRLAVWLVCLLCAPPGAALAQATRVGRLVITVVDSSGGVIPDATVKVIGLETATIATTVSPARTTDTGAATVEGLVPGRYSIEAEFPGFEIGLLTDIRIQAGENKRVVVLPIKKLEDSVTVGPDKQEAGAARANAGFGQSLSDEQIAALSDDPDEAAKQIADLAGSDAAIRVDSFEGQQLPPKSQIKSIHVTRDQFAAETEQPGNTFVDIITQPGVGPIRGTSNVQFHDQSMIAKSPFTATKGPEQIRNYSMNIGGAIVRNVSNFSLAVNGRNDFTTPNLNAVTATGARTDVLNLRQPNTVLNINGLVDYALTRDQTLRFGYTQNNRDFGNLGVGTFDLPERAFNAHDHNYGFRVLEAGPLGRKSFINTRLTMNWENFGYKSGLEAPTIIVQDTFNSGGAQNAGNNVSTNFTFNSDVDHVRGVHSWRAGVQVQGGWFKSDMQQNYLGTYTFPSLAAYQAGQPQLYTRQIGDPHVSYFNAQTGIYVQDDIRVHRGLTLSPGVRYSAQTHVSDYGSLAPRFGVTWAPFKSGRTTLRASGGYFGFWLPTFVLEQTLRLDGTRQRELDIVNPSYPDPGSSGVVPPANKYVMGDFKLQRNARYSAGFDQTISPRVRFNVLYNYIHLLQQARGTNLNPINPATGLRPDPNFANIIETVTDTEIRRHELYANATLSLIAPNAPNRDRINWRRLTLQAGYSMIHARNNSGGPFTPPPTGNPSDDWGPGGADNPYRINLSLISTQVRNLTANLTWNANDGNVYNWTTGTDDNHDGLLNDRPAGVGLRTLRTAPQSTISGRVQYTFANDAPAQGPQGGPGARYRFGIYLNVNNITNHANYTGYSGVQTSPFFMQPTTVINPRKIDVGINVNF